MVMERTPDLPIAAMASETGATMVVSGSYYQTGGTLHVQARLTDVTLARLLRPVETISVPADSAMLAIARLRTRLMATVAPLLDTTTHLRYASPPPSYEAYRDYLAGFAHFVEGDMRAALTLFERAANADSTYHMPRLAATIAQFNLGNNDTAFAQLEQLQRQRDALGPVEQGTLDMLNGVLRGDLPLVYRSVSRIARITPGSINEYMVAETARRLNRPAEALGILRAMGAERGELRGWSAYWRELTYAQHMLGDFESALATARIARVRYPDDATIITAEVRALAALGRADSVIQRVEAVRARGASSERRVGALYRVAAEEMLTRRGLDASTGNSDRHADAMRMAERAVSWYASQNDLNMRGGHIRALLLLDRVNEAATLASQQTRPQRVDKASSARLPSNFVDLGLACCDEQLHARDLGVIAAQQGKRDAAIGWEKYLSELQNALTGAQRGTRWAALHLDRAAIAAQLGDTERAMTMLREATANGLAFWPGLLADPQLAPLHRHPAWASFMRPAG
jgi:tetratricopeptide (TPR) repeat protein